MDFKYQGLEMTNITREEGELVLNIYDRVFKTGETISMNEYNNLKSNYGNLQKKCDDLLEKLNTITEETKDDAETIASQKEIIKDLSSNIKSLKDEIAILERRVNKPAPGEYSTLATALKDSGNITEEEFNEAVTNCSMGRDVKSYWDDMVTEVDNYVDSPMLVTDFGKINVVNCTPHPVVLSGFKGGPLVIGPSDVVTRLQLTREVAHIEGTDLPLVTESKGRLVYVPRRKKNTLYIVSRIVFDVAVDREDFICSNIMDAERGTNGGVTSVPSFICRKSLYKVMEEKGGVSIDD